MWSFCPLKQWPCVRARVGLPPQMEEEAEFQTLWQGASPTPNLHCSSSQGVHAGHQPPGDHACPVAWTVHPALAAAAFTSPCWSTSSQPLTTPPRCCRPLLDPLLPPYFPVHLCYHSALPHLLVPRSKLGWQHWLSSLLHHPNPSG